jgi:tRNA (uracil-5-)-methyltransferase TRM9
MSTMREIFDQIAGGWYNFRHRTIFRTELKELAKQWRGGKLLNIGCAHGPDFIPFKNKFELHGVDFSPAMLRLSKKYATKYKFTADIVEADARHLPYTDESFDWAIAVAMYHHIEDNEERIQALTELHRVLKPGGEAFITVWNRWQPRFWLKSKNIQVPWKSRKKTLYRYYYLFSYYELEKLVKQAGFQLIESFPEDSYHFPIKTFSRNICILVRKNASDES